MLLLLTLPLFILSALALFIYIYLTWNKYYWRKRGVNGPEPRILFGNLPNALLQKRNVAYDIDEIYKKHKGIERFVGIFMTRRPELMIIDPELVKDVLIKNFKNFHDNDVGQWINRTSDPIFGSNPFFANGDEWKTQRGFLVPALTANRVKASYNATKKVCAKVSEYLLKNNQEINIKKVCESFTLDIVSNCIYGIDAGGFEDENSPIMRFAKQIVIDFEAIMYYIFKITIFPLVKNIVKKPLASKDLQSFFSKLTEDAIKLRLSSGADRVDMLSYVIELQKKRNLSDLEVSAIVLMFFTDGFETTSNVIAQCLHMLARHKNMQQHLREEIHEALTVGGELTFETLNNLPFLDQCVNETLRLFPPAPFLIKICTESCDLENYKDKRIVIDKGTPILIPVYSLQRDPDFYEDPNAFNPFRFNEQTGGVKKFKDSGVFLPFGDGPRVCPGIKFGTSQAKAAIVEFVRNWEITLNAKTKQELIMDPKNFLYTQDGGIWLDFKQLF